MKTSGKIREITLHLRGFIEEHVSEPHRWYVGVAFDVEAQLFEHHKVNRKLDSWIYRIADSPEMARSVYEEILRLGCDGKRYPEESDARVVYVYLKSGNTSP